MGMGRGGRKVRMPKASGDKSDGSGFKQMGGYSAIKKTPAASSSPSWRRGKKNKGGEYHGG